MDTTRRGKLAAAGLVAGALLLGAAGIAAAQMAERPGPGGLGWGMMQGQQSHRPGAMHGPGGMGAMMGAMAGHAALAHHAQAEAAVAQALRLTVEEVQAQLAGGKSLAAIAQERGVDLAAVHAAVHAAHQESGTALMNGMMRGMMGMAWGTGGAPSSTACPMLQGTAVVGGFAPAA